MILSTYRRRLENRPRNAFTLLEVLVVVAILVILASVASVYVFGYLDRAKQDKAKLQAKAIETAAKSYYLRYTQLPPNTQALINPGQGEKPFLEGGNDAIMTPWGGQFTLSEDQRGDANEMVILVRWVDADGRQHNQFEKPGQ
jgi:general secretion pathway protein G